MNNMDLNRGNNINNNLNYTPQNNNNPRQMSPSQRERSYIRRDDQMGNFLTDKQNEKELNMYMKNQKESRQKFYKEMLDDQVNEIQTVNNRRLVNGHSYRTDNPLIREQQRKYVLTDDPYNTRRNSDFGRTNLSHNPITNPQNNLQYNKYIDNYIQENYMNDNYGGNNFNNNMNDNNYGGNNFNNNMNNNYGGNNFNNNMNNNYGGNNFNDGSNYNNYNNGPNNNYGNNFNGNGGNNFGNNYNNYKHSPTPNGEKLRQAALQTF
jgi:hypothetical protein